MARHVKKSGKNFLKFATISNYLAFNIAVKRSNLYVTVFSASRKNKFKNVTDILWNMPPDFLKKGGNVGHHILLAHNSWCLPIRFSPSLFFTSFPVSLKKKR